MRIIMRFTDALLNASSASFEVDLRPFTKALEKPFVR